MSRGPATSRAASELAVAWFGTLVWVGLSAVLVVALGDDPELRGSPWALAMVLFPVIGVVLFASTLRLTAGWVRFGRLTLDPDPSPGSLGGHVGGSVFVAVRHRHAADFRVTLACVHSTIRQTSDGKRRAETVVWTDEGVPVVERQGRGVRLRFTFQIPSDLPPTEGTRDDGHVWSVRVEGRVPGVDLDRVFDVEVARTDSPMSASIPAPIELPSTAGLRDSIGPVRVERRQGATVLDYPAGREWGMGLALTLFGLFFFSFPVGMAGAFFGGGLPSGGFEWIMGLFVGPMILIFALVGGLMMLLGLFVLLNRLVVEFGPGNVTSTRRILFLKMGRTVAIEDVDRVEMKVSGQVGSGAKARVSYRIVARTKNGRRLVLGDGIRGAPAARAIAARIDEWTGLPVADVGRKRKAKKAR